MATIPEEIGTILNRLPADKQRQVLDYARNLESLSLPLSAGTSISNLLRFAGSLPKETVDEMAQAIEAESERIEPSDDISF